MRSIGVDNYPEEKAMLKKIMKKSSITAKVSTILLLVLVAAFEYGEPLFCRVNAVDADMSGILLALPAYNYCTFVWYHEDESNAKEPFKQHDGLLNTVSTVRPAGGEPSKVFGKLRPCLKMIMKFDGGGDREPHQYGVI